MQSLRHIWSMLIPISSTYFTWDKNTTPFGRQDTSTIVAFEASTFSPQIVASSCCSVSAILSYLDVGTLISISPSEIDLLVATAPSVYQSSVSFGVWQIDEVKVEDGWTTVKRKKSKPSTPPLEMNLRSCKEGSKSKSKS